MTTRRWFAVLAIPLFLAACGGEGEGAPSPRPGAGEGEEPPLENAVAQADAYIARQTIDKSRDGWRTRLPKPPKFTFDRAHTYTWVLETTQGTMKFRLLADTAPMHVSSTIYLTRLGFYDDLGFHRVIQGFMAQGGCPLGTGTGGPGYTYEGEFAPGIVHDKPGLLSMANAGPGTDGSQFFLTFKPTSWLDGKHTVFGEVTGGADVIRKLESLGQPGQAPSHTPREPIKIRRATIEVR
jgi:peptidyl-prolyl cis-trans isomerase B (cyclophilin B)